jgi:hypothetical protein
MKTADITTALPGEMLERILRLLPPRALKAAVLVCRRWREVGEAPGLWAPWVSLTAGPWNLASMPEAVGSRRLQALSSLWLWAVSEELLEAVAAHPALASLALHADVSRVEPQLVARALSTPRSLALSGLARLTVPQATALCRTLASPAPRPLTSLLLARHPAFPAPPPLAAVSPALLTRAARGLAALRLMDAGLTKPQLAALRGAAGHCSLTVA